MSSDDSKPRFPPLNDANYVEWAIRAEAELVRKKLWYNVIEIEAEPPEDASIAEREAWWAAKLAKRSKEKLAEARAELILRVEDSQLAHMKSRDPLEIWEELKKVHIARGLASRLALRRRWWRMVKGDKEAMSAWIGRVKGAAHQLVEIGVQVSDEDRILVLTNGLDATYESFVISLDVTPADQLTLELVVNRLLNEEVRRENQKEQDMERLGVEGNSGSVFAARSSGVGTGSAGSGSGPRVCWYCNQVGHIKMFCPLRSKGGEGSDKQVAQVALSARGQGAGTDVSQLVDLGTVEIGGRMPGHVY